MNGRGKLTIEAGNASLDDRYVQVHGDVEPGQYVVLAVTDTGSGMAPDVLEKAFNPFFTTKEPGSGTGLGLSMVYGLVKQSGGHINIYSEVGVGTTVRVYLPRTHAAEEASSDNDLGTPAAKFGKTDTILVVEDDAIVRATAVETLHELGFTVLQATNADQALAVLESGVKVDILFTDVVMPGTLRSPELARRAKQILPDLGVLFTSGYTENAIVHAGRLDHGVDLLSKPYNSEQLVQKIHRVMAKVQKEMVPSGSIDENAAALRTSSLRVLVVEDEVLIRLNLADMLESIGAEVTQAATLTDAQSAFAPDRFDIVVTDISLPDGSAENWVSDIVGQGHCGIVISSGHPPSGALAELVTRKAVSVLSKPYELRDVERCIAERSI